MNYLWYRPLLLYVAAPLMLLTAGCATNDSMPSLAEIQINELLGDIRKGAEADEIKSCLFTRSYDHVEVVNEQRLVFFKRGGDAWLNELRHPCTGLRRNDPLAFDLRGNSVCNLDQVTSFDSINRGTLPRATCTLGKFTKIPDWQVERVEMLLDEL